MLHFRVPGNHDHKNEGKAIPKTIFSLLADNIAADDSVLKYQALTIRVVFVICQKHFAYYSQNKLITAIIILWFGKVT